MKNAVLAFSLVAIGLATACATSTKTIIADSDPTETVDAGTAKAKDAGKPPVAQDPPVDDTGASSSSGGSSSGGAGTCGGEATYDACITCCETAHPQGANTYIGALVSCLCEPANCSTACSATLCASTPANPDSTCSACLNTKSSGCGTDVQTACSADPDCVAFAGCLQTAACDAKP